MTTLDEFKKVMREVSHDKFIETISIGALKLSKAQIETVQFVFWLVYMAEIDLNHVLVESWKKSTEIVKDPAANELAKEMLKEMVLGKKQFSTPLEEIVANLPKDQAMLVLNTVHEQYQKKRDIEIENPEYFIDKIRIFEAMFGKNKRTKVLWNLNGLRNDIGHNRIDGLKYEEQDLTDRSVKEKLLQDYFESTQSTKLEESDFWNSLSPDEQEVIKTKMNELRMN